MPELPDVEVFKRYLDATALHKTIKHVDVEAPALLEDMSVRSLQQRLTGHRFENTRRHGKYLLVELDSGSWLVMHFGMSGSLQYFKTDKAPPKYAQVTTEFDNGYALAYVAPRKLGKIAWVESAEDWVNKQELGTDALAVDEPSFRELAQSRKAVKCWLTEQTLFAGIGNIYSDEILFQARLHPKRSVDELDDGELARLFKAMKEVLTTAIDKQADPDAMPKSYLLPHRKEGSQCPQCKGKVAKISACGRTGYYCPKCQPR